MAVMFKIISLYNRNQSVRMSEPILKKATKPFYSDRLIKRFENFLQKK
jgi:hypothetical protein